MMKKNSRIYVAGHSGLVGSALVKTLLSKGYEKIITRNHAELDLTRETEVETFFKSEKPEYVLLAAAKVGGILANLTYPAEFISTNIKIQTNIIHSSYLFGVKKLLFLGSSCIYPKKCPQPIKEEYLLTGHLETTNEPYAIAKIAGIKMCHAYNRQYKTNFICVMPTNLYGPNDNFNLDTSHVMPALLRKFHQAKINGHTKVVIWGTGSPLREFLHVEDMADACLYLMNIYNGKEIINIGVGKDLTISELAQLIAHLIGFKGEIIFDPTKPDGTPRKLLDITRLKNLGWQPKIDLNEGIIQTYEWFKAQSTI